MSARPGSTTAAWPRPSSRNGLAAICAVVGCVLTLAACEVTGGTPADATEPEAWMTINGARVALELAHTPAEQRVGLGGRDSLAWNRGMLFLYEEPSFPSFWMRGMRFDIDIVWLRGDRIVDISHGVQHVPGGNGPTVRPRELTDQVLEVPAGYAAAHGWRMGHQATLERH